MNRQTDDNNQRQGGGMRAMFILLVSTIAIHTGCATRQAGVNLPVDTRMVLLTPEQALAYAAREDLRESAARARSEDGINTASRGFAETTDTPQKENSRRPARVRVLHVGRSIDPVDPRVMHEAHTVYILDEDETWQLDPKDGKLRLPRENPPCPPSSPAGGAR